MKVALALTTCVVLAVPAIAGDPSRTADGSAQPSRGASQSAQAVFLAYVAAWNHHDPEAIGRLLDPESVHEDVPAGFRGHAAEEIKAFARDVFKAQPDLTWRLTTIVARGSTVAAEWTWTSTYTGDGPTGPVKGRKISARGASIAVVDGDHIRRFVDYYDFASAFSAASGGAK